MPYLASNIADYWMSLARSQEPHDLDDACMACVRACIYARLITSSFISSFVAMNERRTSGQVVINLNHAKDSSGGRLIDIYDANIQILPDCMPVSSSTSSCLWWLEMVIWNSCTFCVIATNGCSL